VKKDAPAALFFLIVEIAEETASKVNTGAVAKLSITDSY
jgi:hypothetical protein